MPPTLLGAVPTVSCPVVPDGLVPEFTTGAPDVVEEPVGEGTDVSVPVIEENPVGGA